MAIENLAQRVHALMADANASARNAKAKAELLVALHTMAVQLKQFQETSVDASQKLLISLNGKNIEVPGGLSPIAAAGIEQVLTKTILDRIQSLGLTKMI